MATINSFISRAFIFVSLKFIVPSASKEPGNSGICIFVQFVYYNAIMTLFKISVLGMVDKLFRNFEITYLIAQKRLKRYLQASL